MLQRDPDGRLRRAVARIALAIAASSCAHTAPAPPAPAIQPAAEEIRQRVVLVGDAGDREGGAALLRALGRFVDDHALSARTALVYLGDDFYPRGAVVVDAEGVSQEVQNQLDAGPRRGRTFFLPGNHDWDASPLAHTDLAVGITRLRALERYVGEDPAKPARWLPRPGCPGPESVELSGLKLIALDSQWWLIDEPGRTKLGERLGCQPRLADDVIDALARELACASDPCPPRLLVAHHPLRSEGPHGGYFPWHEHLLCSGGLPLPGLCSLYVLARRSGISRQDLSSEPYRRFVERVSAVLAQAPPLLFAAGHEHSLQVLHAEDAPLVVVSGSGSKRTPVRPGDGYRASRKGFVVLDVLRDGRALLSVYEHTAGEEIGAPAHREFLSP